MRLAPSIGTLAVGLLLLAAAVQTHGPADPLHQPAAPPPPVHRPCAAMDQASLRGTYALSATGWQDLSEINPALPKGSAPVSVIGAFKLDGNGEVTGWGLINAGGVQLDAEIVDSRFSAPRPDCSVAISLSMRINESGGIVSGPYSYVGVVAGDASEREVRFMMLGTGPGSHVDMQHARRISK